MLPRAIDVLLELAGWENIGFYALAVDTILPAFYIGLPTELTVSFYCLMLTSLILAMSFVPLLTRRGYDEKIRIVLNKADGMDQQQMMRVYGTLM